MASKSKRHSDNDGMDIQVGKKKKLGQSPKDKAGRQNAKSDRTSTKEIAYLTEIKELKETIPSWDNMFSSKVDPEDRSQAWMRLEILGEPLIQKYAWAIPDERALKICSEFGPIIEVGAGKGYWAWLLKQRGVDIIAFDKYAYKEKGWMEVKKGDPSVLSTDAAKSGRLTPGSKAAWTRAPPLPSQAGAHAAMKDDFNQAAAPLRTSAPVVDKPRTLLLSYPDQGESMASECLKHFQGDTIIHVGELLTGGTGTKSGGSQAPWGKTTNSDFQVELAESFHCVLSYALPCMPFSKDYLTVWVRTGAVERRASWRTARTGRHMKARQKRRRRRRSTRARKMGKVATPKAQIPRHPHPLCPKHLLHGKSQAATTGIQRWRMENPGMGTGMEMRMMTTAGPTSPTTSACHLPIWLLRSTPICCPTGTGMPAGQAP